MSNLPAVIQPTSDDPFDMEQQRLRENERQEKIREAATGIVNRLHLLARNAVQLRASNVERRWLDNIRAYQGKYDEAIEKFLRDCERNGIARSRAFVKICRTKTDAWEARLSDLLFPADDRNWGINPTPVPELSENAELAAQQALKAEAMAEEETARANDLKAQGQDPSQAIAAAEQAGAAALAFKQASSLAQKEMEEARRRTELMAKEIDDQLTECLYPKRSRDAIRDLCRLGTAVIKGPLTANRPRRKWSKVPTDGGGAEVFKLQSEPDPRPEYRRVDPWHFYPDPNATDMDDCEYTLERHLPTKKMLKQMARTLGFDKEAVRILLEEGTGFGTQDDFRHINDLRSITGEGEVIKDRFVMWEYNGPLEVDEICTLLCAAGQHDEAEAWQRDCDPLDEHMVTMFFCNGQLLKLAQHYVLDSGETLYSVCSFSPGEASVMGGRGVPDLMLDTLRALNAAWRMMLDNAAMSTIPQIFIDKTMVEPEDGQWRLTPGKIWVKRGQEVPQNGYKPFDVFPIDINQTQIAGIIELALKFIDDEVSLPMIAQGEQGQQVTQTVGGMTILFNSANVVFRRVVKNWDDDITTPNIRRAYDWNMQFNPKDEIKGDMQAEARGTSVLLVREIQSQNLMQIVMNWSTHPILGAALKVYSALRMAIQSLGVNPDDIIQTEEQFKKNLQNMQEGGPSADEMRAQATIDAAKIQAESRKLDGETQREIALIRRDTELIQLAQMREISLEKLSSMLHIKQMEVDSKERIFAAEAGVQTQARREAAQLGQQAPSGGGGTV